MKPASAYQRKVQSALERGEATEHTQRPALKQLLEGLAPAITATNESKRPERGAPDYVVARDTPHRPLA